VHREGIFHWENLIWHSTASVANSMQGNPNIRATGKGAWRLMGKFWCHPPQKYLFLRQSGPPPNTSFLGPTEVHIRNGILIGAAILQGSQSLQIGQTDRQTNHATPSISTGRT